MGGTAGGVPPGTVVVKLPRNWRSTSFHGTEREIPLFISLSTAHRHVGAILHSPRSGSRNKLHNSCSEAITVSGATLGRDSGYP